MPDIIQSAENIQFTGSTTVAFPAAFYTTCTPAVSTSVTGLGSGDFIEITNKTHTGFTITAKDSGGFNLTTQTELDYVARGFGKET